MTLIFLNCWRNFYFHFFADFSLSWATNVEVVYANLCFPEYLPTIGLSRPTISIRIHHAKVCILGDFTEKKNIWQIPAGICQIFFWIQSKFIHGPNLRTFVSWHTAGLQPWPCNQIDYQNRLTKDTFLRNLNIHGWVLGLEEEEWQFPAQIMPVVRDIVAHAGFKIVKVRYSLNL